MDNLLSYYYNIKESEIIPMEGNYLILDNNDYSYLLKKINKNNNINYAINILTKLNNSNFYGSILKNVQGGYISNYDNKNYVLIELKGVINEEILLKDIVHNNLKYRNIGNKYIDLIDLWSKKIDYLEYQISELAKDNQIILNSFSFFVGLGENAISFININNINYNNVHKTLSHTRIKNRELYLDYYNPLNILIDYDIRDYAEYIKAKILINDDILKDINYILDNANLSVDDIKLLYARIMFPTLYFDEIENVLIDKKNEEQLELYIDNINNYLNCLNDIYIEIKKRGIFLDIPKWLIKEH